MKQVLEKIYLHFYLEKLGKNIFFFDILFEQKIRFQNIRYWIHLILSIYTETISSIISQIFDETSTIVDRKGKKKFMS